MKRRDSAGFTLVELLVVIAVMGILVAMLLPAVQAAREAARRVSCMNNMNQVIIAVHNYESSHMVFPPGTIDKTGPIVSAPNGYHHSWIVQILPQLDQMNFYKMVDSSVSVYDAKNLAVRSMTINSLHCPSTAKVLGCTNYAAVHHDIEAPIDVDNNGVFFLNSRISFDDIKDGSSHTLFIGEKPCDPVSPDLGWMSGTNATLHNMGTPGAAPTWGMASGQAELPGMEGLQPDVPSNQDGEANADPATATGTNKPGLAVGTFSSPHPGTQVFAFGDGHVSCLSANIDAGVRRRLGHRADGRVVSPNGW